MNNESMIISYSEMSRWDTCERQWYYHFGLGLSPNELSKAITTGSKGHKLLQNFYTLIREGHSKEDALEITRKSAVNLMNKEGLGDFPLALAWTLVDNYIRENVFTLEAEIIENRFLVPVNSIIDAPDLEGVQIGFTPDVVFKRKGGFLDVEDAKFVERAWSKSKLNRYPQSRLYHVFLSRMGYNVVQSRVRFFNVKTGKITEQNYPLKKVEEEILLRDFVGGIRQVIKFRRLPFEEQMKARRTTNFPSCQFCAFEFPCTLEAEGKSAQSTFDTQYMKNDYDYSR